MTARSTTLITLLVLFAPQSALAVIPGRRRKSFSTGTTIGIVVAIVIIVIITLVIFFLRRRRIRNANRAYATAAQGPINGSLKIRHPSTTGVSAGGYHTTADPEAQNYATQPMSQVKFPEPSHQTAPSGMFQPPSGPPPPASGYNPSLNVLTSKKPTLPPYTTEGNDNSRYSCA
ncbi:hypothetical protein FRB95_008736 [Tulasnella sp. JGI-2019a]|nr:hypothetical protein FRB95_008736 [Tulasnella sp. JGI-2019a]